jgi:hypothetical protein
MPTNQKKVVFNAPAELVAALDAESARTDVPVAALCRRAIRLLLFAEQQTSRKSTRQPVLFTPQQETR